LEAKEMSETTSGLSFENQRFDHQRLTSSGSANSSLEDDTSKLWTPRDKNVSFWGPDRLLFYIVAKFDATRNSETIAWGNPFQSKNREDQDCLYVRLRGALDAMKPSANLFSHSLKLEPTRDLDLSKTVASAYAKVWGEFVSPKLEDLHPITKPAYATLRQIPISSKTRDAINAMLDQFTKALPLNVAAPPLRLVRLEDSSCLLEWTFKDRRLGFSFEVDPKDSGWYFVYSNNSSERYESGTMDQLELSRLISMTLKP
jgi:hypothetical protein